MYRLILPVLMLSFHLVSAQKMGEGVITYSVLDLTEGVSKSDIKFSNELVFSIKGSFSRVDIATDAASFTYIYDRAADRGVKVVGNDIIELNTAILRKLQDADIKETSPTGETKQIAGIPCEKMMAEVFHPSSETTETVEIWMAKGINLSTPADLIWLGANGLPMEFDFTFRGVRKHVTATKFEDKPVNAELMKFHFYPDGQPILSSPVQESIIEVK